MSKDISWIGEDHRGADLRSADLRGKVLFQTDLRGAQLYNAAISLTCDTFDGLKLDDIQVAMLVRLIALADVSEDWRDGLLALVRAIVGPEQDDALSRYLRTHLKTF